MGLVDVNQNSKKGLKSRVKRLNVSSGKQYWSSLPHGRNPWRLVHGLQYDLEDTDNQEGEEVNLDDLDLLAEDLKVEEGARRRNENYELDSFVCENGYLSAEELFESPEHHEKRIEIAKMRRASEKKARRARLKFEVLSQPEVIGIVFATAIGTCRPTLKKWKPVQFESSPIPTGLSIEQNLARQALHELGFGHCSLPSASHSLSHGPESDKGNMVNPLHCSNLAGDLIAAGAHEEPMSLDAAHENREATETEETGSSTATAPMPSQESQGETEMIGLKSRELEMKYRLKYAVKEYVYQTLSARPADDASGEVTADQLTKSIRLNHILPPDLGGEGQLLTPDHQQHLRKYVYKYFFKYKTLNRK